MTIPIAHIRSQAETRLIDTFRASNVSNGPRADAFATFEASGLPTRRIEAYHYTDLRNLIRDVPPIAAPLDSAALTAATATRLFGDDTEGDRLVFVDGAFAAALSSVSDALLVTPLDNAETSLLPGDAPLPGGVEGDPILALNTAFLSGGATVALTRGQGRLRVAHLRTRSTAELATTRLVVDVPAGADFTLVESFEDVSGAPHQTNHLTILTVGDSAHVHHVVLNAESSSAIHLASLIATLGREAELSSHRATLGSAVARAQSFVRFAGTHARCHLSGVTLLRNRQHADTTLVVDHAVPHGTSREFFRNIVDGDATAVFQGKIIVAPHAQKTDGGMKSQTVLLSDTAAMHNKPELEIFADDVVCGHGATCGALDEDQLFYARSRGLPRPEAEALLLESFAGEAIEQVADEAIRDALRERVRTWLDERSAAARAPLVTVS